MTSFNLTDSPKGAISKHIHLGISTATGGFNGWGGSWGIHLNPSQGELKSPTSIVHLFLPSLLSIFASFILGHCCWLAQETPLTSTSCWIVTDRSGRWDHPSPGLTRGSSGCWWLDHSSYLGSTSPAPPTLLFFSFFVFLATPQGLGDLSSPTWD